MRACFSTAIVTGAALVAAAAAEPPVAASPSAEKILRLFDNLRAAETARQAGRRQPVSFQLTDGEINEYMRYALKTAARPGIESVNVKLFANNYVSTFTLVDFDAVERWNPGAIPGLLRPVLSGKKSVWVDCRFQTTGGQATFSVEKAYYQNVRLPAFCVAKVIQIVAARQPEKYDTSKPLPLPFGLRQVWTADHAVMGQN